MALPPTRVDSRALYTPSAKIDSPAMSVVIRSTSVNKEVTPAPKCLHQPEGVSNQTWPQGYYRHTSHFHALTSALFM